MAHVFCGTCFPVLRKARSCFPPSLSAACSLLVSHSSLCCIQCVAAVILLFSSFLPVVPIQRKKRAPDPLSVRTSARNRSWSLVQWSVVQCLCLAVAPAPPEQPPVARSRVSFFFLRRNNRFARSFHDQGREGDGKLETSCGRSSPLLLWLTVSSVSSSASAPDQLRSHTHT